MSMSSPARHKNVPPNIAGAAINADDRQNSHSNKKRKPLSRRPTHSLLPPSPLAVAQSTTGSLPTRTSSRLSLNAHPTNKQTTPSDIPKHPITTSAASSSPSSPSSLLNAHLSSLALTPKNTTTPCPIRKSSRLVAKRRLDCDSTEPPTALVPTAFPAPSANIPPQTPAQLKKRLLTPSAQPIPRKRRRGDVSEIDVKVALVDDFDGSELERGRRPRHSARLENKTRSKRKVDLETDNIDPYTIDSAVLATERRNRRSKAQTSTKVEDMGKNLISDKKKNTRPRGQNREPLVARNHQSSELSPKPSSPIAPLPTITTPTPRTRARKRQRRSSSPKIEPACIEVIIDDSSKVLQQDSEQELNELPRVSVEADSDASDETLVDVDGQSKLPLASVGVDIRPSQLSPLSELSSLPEGDEPMSSGFPADADGLDSRFGRNRVERKKGSVLVSFSALADAIGPNPLVVISGPQPGSKHRASEASKFFREIFFYPHPAFPKFFAQQVHLDNPYTNEICLKESDVPIDTNALGVSKRIVNMVALLMLSPNCLGYRIHQRQCLLARRAGRPWGALPVGMLFPSQNTGDFATGINQVNVLIALFEKCLGGRIKARQAAARMRYRFGSFARRGIASIASESRVPHQGGDLDTEATQMGMTGALEKLLAAGLVNRIARKQKEGTQKFRRRSSLGQKDKERGKWRKNERRVASAWVERVLKEQRKVRRERQKEMEHCEDGVSQDESIVPSAMTKVESERTESVLISLDLKDETEVNGFSIESEAKPVMDTIEEQTKDETQVIELKESYIPSNQRDDPRKEFKYCPKIPSPLRHSISIVTLPFGSVSESRLEGDESQVSLSRSSSFGSSFSYEDDLLSSYGDEHENDENENSSLTSEGTSSSTSPTSPTSPETPGSPGSTAVFPRQHEQSWHTRHRVELPVWKCASLSRVEQSCQIYGVETVKAAIASEAAAYSKSSGSSSVASSSQQGSSSYCAYSSNDDSMVCDEDDFGMGNDAYSDADGEYELDLEYEGYEEFAAGLRNISVNDASFDEFGGLDNIEGIDDDEWDDIDMDTLEMNEVDAFELMSDDSSDDDEDDEDSMTSEKEDERQEGELTFQLESETPAEADVGGTEITFAIKPTLSFLSESGSSNSHMSHDFLESPSDEYTLGTNAPSTQMYDPDFYHSSPNPHSPGPASPMPSLSALSDLSRIPALCLRDTMQPMRDLGTPDNSCGSGRRAWLEAAEAVDAARRTRDTTGINGQLQHQQQEQHLHSHGISNMTGIDEMNSLHACQPLQPLQQMQTLESMPIQGMQDMQMQSLMVVDPMTQACGHHDQAHALADNMFWGLLGFNVGVGVGMGIGMGVGMGMQYSMPHPHPINPVSSMNSMGSITPLNPMTNDFEIGVGVGGFDSYGSSATLENVGCSPCAPSPGLEVGMPMSVPVGVSVGLDGCMNGELGTGTSEFANVFGAEDENRERQRVEEDVNDNSQVA